MSEWFWVLWCILGAILIVAEIFTSGFVLLWFGIGALAAAFAGLIGIDSLAIQFMIFAVVSVDCRSPPTPTRSTAAAAAQRSGRAIRREVF